MQGAAPDEAPALVAGIERTLTSPSRRDKDDVDNVERKLSSYQTLGVISTLLFGFSATALLNVATPREVERTRVVGVAVLLASTATASSMVSTFVFIYHVYHGDSLLSTRRSERSESSGVTPAMMTFAFIDATRGQRLLARVCQGVAASTLLASLSVIVLVYGERHARQGVAWTCIGVVLFMAVVALSLTHRANQIRLEIRHGGPDAIARYSKRGRDGAVLL